MPSTSNLRSQLWFSTFTVLSLAILAKLCGALKEVALAKQLGASDFVDQFVFAFTVATWPAALATSVLTIALTPLLANMKQHNDTSNERFIAQLWGASFAVSLLLGVLLGAVFPLLSPMARAGGEGLAWMVGTVTFLSCMSALIGVILMCLGNQIGTLLDGLPSLVLGVLLMVGIWQADVVLTYGVVIGMVLRLAFLWVTYHRQVGGIALAWPQSSPQWLVLGSSLGYSTAGYAIDASVSLVDLSVASGFEAGSVASLGYAARITALATGLIATAVHRVAIVHFCQAQSRRLESASAKYRLWLRVFSLFSLGSLVLSLVLIYFSNELVALIFQRGRFDEQASEKVAHLMRWSVAQLGPYVATAVLCAYLSATGGFKEIFLACLVSFSGHMLAACVGSKHFGLAAIAAAPLVGQSAMLIFLLIVVLKRAVPRAALRSSWQT